MSDLKQLEARLHAALSRLEAARSRPAAEGDPERLKALVAENAELRASLASLAAVRQADVDRLDALIAQLRPLVEELG
jgi:hypothetical protein